MAIRIELYCILGVIVVCFEITRVSSMKGVLSSSHAEALLVGVYPTKRGFLTFWSNGFLKSKKGNSDYIAV